MVRRLRVLEERLARARRARNQPHDARQRPRRRLLIERRERLVGAARRRVQKEGCECAHSHDLIGGAHGAIEQPLQAELGAREHVLGEQRKRGDGADQIGLERQHLGVERADGLLVGLGPLAKLRLLLDGEKGVGNVRELFRVRRVERRVLVVVEAARVAGVVAPLELERDGQAAGQPHSHPEGQLVLVERGVGEPLRTAAQAPGARQLERADDHVPAIGARFRQVARRERAREPHLGWLLPCALRGRLLGGRHRRSATAVELDVPVAIGDHLVVHVGEREADEREVRGLRPRLGIGL